MNMGVYLAHQAFGHQRLVAGWLERFELFLVMRLRRRSAYNILVPVLRRRLRIPLPQ